MPGPSPAPCKCHDDLGVSSGASAVCNGRNTATPGIESSVGTARGPSSFPQQVLLKFQNHAFHRSFEWDLHPLQTATKACAASRPWMIPFETVLFFFNPFRPSKLHRLHLMIVAWNLFATPVSSGHLQSPLLQRTNTRFKRLLLTPCPAFHRQNWTPALLFAKT